MAVVLWFGKLLLWLVVVVVVVVGRRKCSSSRPPACPPPHHPSANSPAKRLLQAVRSIFVARGKGKSLVQPTLSLSLLPP